MDLPSYDRKVEREVARRFIKISIGLSTLLVIAFIHAVNWDQFFVEVIPLQIKQTIGGMSAQDDARLAEICKIRKHLDCVEKALAGEYTNAPKQIETLVELGHLQVQRHEYKQAANTFATYFKVGGLSVDGSVDYAKALGEVGMIDQAAQYYQRVIDSKPNTMQISVTQAYVRLLVGHNRYQDAKNLIETIRAKGGNASLFMEDEMQKIERASQVTKM